jgi:hypothetical protein
VDYPFADRLYSGALDVIGHVKPWGPTVILSDGDVVFQPRKVQRSGLFEAVGGRVLIYIHTGSGGTGRFRSIHWASPSIIRDPPTRCGTGSDRTGVLDIGPRIEPARSGAAPAPRRPGPFRGWERELPRPLWRR